MLRRLAGRAPPSAFVKKSRHMTTPALAPDDTRRAGAVLLAAGQIRDAAVGFDPCWAPLSGIPMLVRSVAIFARAPEIADIVLVVALERLADAIALRDAQRWQRAQVIAAPGPRLMESLPLALDAISPDIAWIVVHDAARPLVSSDMVAAGLDAVVAQPGVSAAAAFIPVNETLKRVQNGIVVETPDRSRLALLQSPQVIERSALRAALDRVSSDMNPPDAASLAIAAGLRVRLFPGSPENLRVVSPDDLALAESLLARR